MIMLTCTKNGNNPPPPQKKRADKLLLVVAVVDGPFPRAVVDAGDPSFSPKLKRNTKPKLVIYY